MTASAADAEIRAIAPGVSPATNIGQVHGPVRFGEKIQIDEGAKQLTERERDQEEQGNAPTGP